MDQRPTYEELEKQINALQNENDEIRKAKQAIEESESLHRTILENISDAVIVTDDHSKIIYVCPNVNMIFGLSPSQVFELGTIQALINGNACDLSELRKVQEIPNIEWTVVDQSGKERLVLITAKLLTPEDGTFLYVMRDVSERKLMHDALQHSNDLLRAIIEAAPVAIIGLDLDGKVHSVWNPAAEKMLGWSAQEAMGRLLPSVPAEGQEEFRGFREQIRRGMTLNGVEVRRQRRDGTPIDYSIYGSPLYDADGNISGNIAVLVDIAERKQMERELILREREYRTLVESLPDFVVRYDLNLRRVYVNPAWEKASGLSAAEVIGVAHTDIPRVPFPIVDEYVQKLQQVLETGVTQTIEFSWVNTNGVKLFLDYIIVPEYDHNGKIAGLLAVGRDITDRKQAEEALQEKQNQLLEAQHIAHIGNWWHDLVTGEIYWSDEFFDIIGLEPQKPTPELAFSLIHPDDLHILQHALNEADAGKTEHEHEFRIIRPDGGIRWINNRWVGIYDEAGKEIKRVGTHQDITDRKMAEEALRINEKKYRSLFEDSRDAVYIVTREGEFVDANQAFLNLFGYSRDEMLGIKAQDIHVDPDERPGILEKLDQEGSIQDYEVRFKKKDGTVLDCLLTTTVRLAEEGTVLGYQGIVRDVTAHKRLQAQLMQSQKMQAIGNLAGGVAHDFNNLLTAIMGNAELIYEELSKDNPLRKEVEEIIAAGKRAASLTWKLLAFSRKQVVQPKVLDLNKILEGLEEMLTRLLGEDIALKITPYSDLWKVEADLGQMEQVIMNLVVNARDAMPRGGKLTLETANVRLDQDYFHSHGVEEEPGPYVMLAVSDNGVGMDMETQSHIFEPFFTTKMKGKGTGLGLSTVYGIVKQAGGYIWAYSEPGKGTTFKVYLPRVEKGISSSREKEISVEELRGSETVLVAEDDEALRRVIKKSLRLHGYKVLLAENGEEALQISEAHEGPIHLLLTDVVMPGISGRDVADRLQSRRPELKVIYMSGYTNDAIVRHGVLSPELQFIEKPFTPQGLVQKVREVLNQEED